MKQYNLGIEATLEIIGGKWKALIICLLMSGVKRTGELQRSIDGISQKVSSSNYASLRGTALSEDMCNNRCP